MIDEWKKIGLKVEQKVVPTGPWFSNMRGGTFDVAMEANCQSVVNPLLDTGKYLPHTVYPENYGGYDDQKSIELYDDDAARDRSGQAARRRCAPTRPHTLDTQVARDHDCLAGTASSLDRSYVKGWKISPSHYLNQDLANIWLDK